MKMPDGAYLVGFADDLALVVVAEEAWQAELIANEVLELIANWLNSRHLQLAVHKCEALLVTRRRKYDPPQFEINGELIPPKVISSTWKYGSIRNGHSSTISRK